MEVHPVRIAQRNSEAAIEIAWTEWGPAAFARAEREQKPILLAVTASWSESCVAMEQSCYRRPDVIALVNAKFIPIRVDSDRRPDINERYNLGGWPTTAFLTPTGEILGGGTYVPAEELSIVLSRVAEAFRTRRHEIDRRSAEIESRHDASQLAPAGESAGIDADAIDWVCDRLMEQFDREHGGFGRGSKFPSVPALALLLERYRDAREPRLAHALTTTLDAMSDGPLYDRVEGGFFRCSADRDWGAPHREKLLDDNAALLGLYLDAHVALDRTDYRDCALGVLRYVHATLADQVDGGFFGSQRGDAAYYALDTFEARRAVEPPPVDRTLFVDWNSAMAAAYLGAADIVADPTLRDFGLRSLERVVLAAYRPGGGVAHYYDGHAWERGLLGDQVRAASALVDAAMRTGQLPHLMMAEELMQYAIRTMWDEREGGFFDRALPQRSSRDYGLVRMRLKPLALNCEAARVLARLASAAEKSEYRPRAWQAIASQTGSYRQQGLMAAAYALAVRELMLSEAA